MVFLEEKLLKEKATAFKNKGTTSNKYLKDNSFEAQITVFLSHSHKDKELVKGFIELLSEQGFYIYVDWNDSNMPRVTSGKTAKKIKEKIKTLQLFFFLASENGLNSKWCPWKLGIADSLKNWDNILIIPVVNSSVSYKGQEFLQIYKHLKAANSNVYVVEPGKIFDNYNQILLENFFRCKSIW